MEDIHFNTQATTAHRIELKKKHLKNEKKKINNSIFSSSSIINEEVSTIEAAAAKRAKNYLKCHQFICSITTKPLQ
jgi:hypothetical protein